MMMLDVLKGVRPRKRIRFASVAVGAVFLASLGTAVPAMRANQESGTALVEMLTSGRRTKELRPIVESSDAFLTFSKDIEKVFVGSPDVIKLSTTDKRTLSLNGVKVGRTSLTVVFTGGPSEQFMISVHRDLSVLEGALHDVHANIKAEVAPDRDAIVLTGTVPDASFSARAEQAARMYLSAGKGKANDEQGKANGQVINLIRTERAPTDLETKLRGELTRQGVQNIKVTRITKGDMPSDEEDIFVFDGAVADLRTLDNIRDVLNAMVPGKGDKKDNPRVVNRMTLANGGLEIEKIIEGAIRKEVGAPNVTVSRVSESSFRGEADILVLNGTVPNQTKLTQALALASRLFLQQQLVKNKQEGQFEDITETFAGGLTRNTRRPLQLKSAEEDIKVAADESGALKKKANLQAGTAIGQIQPDSGNSSGGGGGSQFGRLLTNQVESNIGRAKALELADGRILSFLTVDDLPQVRIDIRILEVNRTALLSWDSNLSAKVTDFNQQSTIPHDFALDPDTGDSVPVGLNPGATDNAEFENVLSFLGGGFANNLHISGDHVDIKSFLSLLESEGIARTLSSPSLTVLSGELATFGVGGSIPIDESTLTGTGVSQGRVVFVDFGVSLSIRPLIDERGFITLDVIPQISNPDAQLTASVRQSSGTNPPTTAFATRILRTSSRLRDGQSLLIGGLTEHNRTDDSSQTPWVHKIPLLGWLFKDFNYADGDRDLVIVVNPVIVRDPPSEAPLWAFPDADELMMRPANGNAK